MFLCALYRSLYLGYFGEIYHTNVVWCKNERGWKCIGSDHGYDYFAYNALFWKSCYMKKFGNFLKSLNEGFPKCRTDGKSSDPMAKFFWVIWMTP